MTTNQITTAVRSKVLESGTEILSDAIILLYANLAYQDVCKKIFPNSQILSATVTFTAGTGTLPTDFGTLYGDPMHGTANFFPELSIEDFNKQTLAQSVTIEGGVMKVFPTTTASLTIKYYPAFPDLTASVNPTINSFFHEPIIYGTLARCYEFKATLDQKMADQSNFDEGNQRAGQMFEHQNLIGGLSDSANPNGF